jgi:hypothetical protein
MSFAMVWTLRDGLAVRMEMYADWAEALKAAGLEQPVDGEEGLSRGPPASVELGPPSVGAR